MHVQYMPQNPLVKEINTLTKSLSFAQIMLIAHGYASDRG